jgi:exopolysaccharide biosynthesis polyprenyl glycosylphosphotransferase
VTRRRIESEGWLVKDNPGLSAAASDRNYVPALAWLPRWGLQLSERRALLFAGDCAAAILAVVAALALWTWTASVPTEFSSAYEQSRVYWWVLVPGWLLLNSGSYDLRSAASRRATLLGLTVSVLAALGFYLLVYFYAPPSSLLRLVVFYYIGGAFGLALAWRLVYIAVFTSRSFRRRVIVVGAGWAGESIAAALRDSHSEHYAVVGLIDDDPAKQGNVIGGAPVLGGHEQLLDAARSRKVSDVVLAITGEMRGEMFKALLACQEHGLDVVRMPALYEQLFGRVPIDYLEADWLITSLGDAAQFNNLTRVSKRLTDIVGAGMGLLLLAALLPLVAAAIWLTSRGPIFYTQARVGRAGRSFRVVKFRTMTPDAEADGLARWTDLDDARITPVGRILRRARVDELPQCWNVLRGEMSLVGPRPERPEFISELETAIPFYRARLLVKPGLTGWAQIHFGYGASVEEAAIKLQYDLYYVKHRSLWLDLYILLRTLAVVLGFRGR